MIRESINKLLNGEHLTEEEAETAMGEIFDGRATPVQVASLVTCLRMKGENIDEITGAAKALQARAVRLNMGNHLLNLGRDDINIEGETIVETVDGHTSGTRTFNISTAAAFVAAGAGIKIARHGKRAASIYFGAADVLTGLGINLDISPSEVDRCIQEVGIGFLFTPLSYGPMQHVARIREEMGIRTIFNLIGPLMNPTGASAHVLGVYKPALTETLANVLLRLGAERAFVVCGEATLDEISICGDTRISRLENGQVETFTIEPEDFGFARVDRQAISGGSARENARIIKDILDGKKSPRREVVLLNAAAAFVAAGLDSDLATGIDRARDVIDSGKGREKLDAVVAFTDRCRPFLRDAL